MKCILLCGGNGSRIKSKVKKKNKCFIDVCGMSVMERNLRWLQSHGIYQIIFAFKPNVGTAGALLEFKDILTEDFIVINGDTIQTMDLTAMINEYLRSQYQEYRASVFTHNDEEHNGGVFIFSPRIFGYITSDMINDLWKKCKHLTYKVRNYPYFDVGTPQGLTRARNYFDYKKRKYGS